MRRGQRRSAGALLQAIEKGEAEHASAAAAAARAATSSTLTRDVRFLQWKEAEAATDGAAREPRRRCGSGTGTTSGSSARRDATSTRLKSVDLVRDELTEETFDAAYDELVTALREASCRARSTARRRRSAGSWSSPASRSSSLVGGKLGETLPLNKNENAELNIFLPTSDAFGAAATVLNIAAPILGLIPQFARARDAARRRRRRRRSAAIQLSKAAKYGAEGAKMIADAFKGSAERASKMAGYYRRAEDYVLQANLATSELEQYGRQIISSLLREQVAQARVREPSASRSSNAEPRARRSCATKFTNEELYTLDAGRALEDATTSPTSSRSTSRSGPRSTLKRRADAARVRRAGRSSSSATGTTAARACSPARRWPSTSSGSRWPTSSRTGASTS